MSDLKSIISIILSTTTGYWSRHLNLFFVQEIKCLEKWQNQLLSRLYEKTIYLGYYKTMHKGSTQNSLHSCWLQFFKNVNNRLFDNNKFGDLTKLGI